MNIPSQGFTHRQLFYMVQPMLWLLTAAMVLIDHNYNFGMLHIVGRLANRTRLFNFLQVGPKGRGWNAAMTWELSWDH